MELRSLIYENYSFPTLKNVSVMLFNKLPLAIKFNQNIYK